jgi:triacylglycerol esterase/lipase EstA (alpha/beta hydrolase family)
VRRGALFACLLLAALAGPTVAAADPSGANDWSCKPTAHHPNPVVLVHGTFANMDNDWGAMSPALKAAGYCVFALNYGGYGTAPTLGIYATGPVADSAQQLAVFIARVRKAAGATKVSIVGHSQGGMMPRYYIKFLSGTCCVEDMIGLVPSNHGTTVDGLTTLASFFPGASALFVGSQCPACTDQFVGSSFLTKLNSGNETPGGASYTVVTTRYDEVVTPYTSAFLAAGPNTANITLQDRCPLDPTEHNAISYDPVAIQWVENALARPGPAAPSFQPAC